MLHNIRARNFLSIQQADVHMTRLNLIVGPNSSGKSALLKAIRALTTHLSAQARTQSEHEIENLAFGLPLQGGVSASFSQVMNDSKRGKLSDSAPVPTIDLAAVVSSESSISMFRSGRGSEVGLPSDYVSVEYNLERVTGSETPRIVSNAYAYQAWDVNVENNRANHGRERYWDPDDEKIEFASRPNIVSEMPYISRRFHPIETESPRDASSSADTPSWRWTEHIHRLPDAEGVFQRERPTLFQIVMSDNSDIEWFGQLNLGKSNSQLMVPEDDVDPVTGLIEGIMVALAQLRASARLVGSSLAHYAMDGRADDLDEEGEFLGFSEYGPASENVARLSSEVLEEIAAGQTHGLPDFLWVENYGRPTGFGEAALNALLGEFQSQTSDSSGVDDAIDSAIRVASEAVLFVVDGIFNDAIFGNYLDSSIQVAMKEARFSQRNLESPSIHKSRFLAAFKYEPFLAAVARALDNFDGTIAERTSILECASMLSIAAPHRLRGEVWRRIELEDLTIPPTIWSLAQPPNSRDIETRPPLTAERYLKKIGRVGSDKSINFSDRNFYSEQSTGAGDRRFQTVVPPAHPKSSQAVTSASESLRTWAENVSHVEALRLPSPFSPVSNDKRVSPDGANSIQLIERFGTTQITRSPLPIGARANRKLADRKDEDLNTCLGAWLKHLGLIKSFSHQQKQYAGTRLFVKTPHDKKSHDLSQVGSGVAQVLPILLAPLLIDPGETVVLEEPEAHLHPAAQAALGDFLVACAASGRQIIVETHSEHIVNRVRRRIAEGRLASTDAQMLGVEADESGTKFVPNAFAEDGSFLGQWPEGFLGVSLDEALELSKLRQPE